MKQFKPNLIKAALISGGMAFGSAPALAQDENTDAIDEADDFIDNYINPIIIFAYSLQNFVLLFWLIIGRYLIVWLAEFHHFSTSLPFFYECR